MRTFDLVGVVEDGAPWDQNQVPQNPRRTLRLTRGQDTTLRMVVRTRGGVPVDLSDGGTSLVMTVKRQSDDQIPVVLVAGTKIVGQRGRADFTLSETAFRRQDAGRYVYDVWITRTVEGRDAVLPLSPLLLEPSATKVP